MHYSREVGQQMIDMMAAGCEIAGEDGWGGCLRRDDIDDHLAGQWQRYTDFHDQHRTEITHFRQRMTARSKKQP